MKLSFLWLTALCLSGSEALTTSTTPTTTRRDVFRQTTIAGAEAFATLFLPSTSAVWAVEACPRGSQNCIVTTWTPPPGTSKATVASTIQSVFQAYPQEGQNGVDNMGWQIVQDDLGGSGKARVEYKNFGNFAKWMNGGNPFVDDLVVEIGSDNYVAVRSSSRVGDGDMGVNQKRLIYLASELKAKGWEVATPKY